MSADANAVATARHALAAVRARIDAVPRAWSHPVEVMAVTKAFGAETIAVAVDAGCRSIGENYAQELLAKRPAIEALDPSRRPTIHFIGHLQSNKVRQLAGLVDVWATVDRASLAKEIARRDPGATVLLQVNSTGEDQKGGCPPEAIDDLVGRCRELGLQVDGLLTIGPTGRPPEDARPGFELVRSAVDRHGFAVCSMGMTADLEIAVAAGSTQVRVGTALFGPRPSRPGAADRPAVSTEPSDG